MVLSIRVFSRLISDYVAAKQLMKIAREKVEQLQKLAKEKGGDIASKASQKAGEIPGLKEIPGAGAVRQLVPPALPS